MCILRYTVLPNDTYSSMAAGVSNCAPVTLESLQALNPNVCLQKLEIGEILNIPHLVDDSKVAFRYTVRMGDNITSVINTLRHSYGRNITSEEIQAANPSVPPSHLCPGLVIAIPIGQERPFYYTIRGEETYRSIARGINACRGITADKLAAANPSKKNSILKPNDVLMVPVSDQVLGFFGFSQDNATNAPYALLYTVRPGDTFASIARSLHRCQGVTEDLLQAANKGHPATALQPGRCIWIPYPKKSIEANQPSKPSSAETTERCRTPDGVNRKPTRQWMPKMLPRSPPRDSERVRSLDAIVDNQGLSRRRAPRPTEIVLPTLAPPNTGDKPLSFLNPDNLHRDRTESRGRSPSEQIDDS